MNYIDELREKRSRKKMSALELQNLPIFVLNQTQILSEVSWEKEEEFSGTFSSDVKYLSLNIELLLGSCKS